MTLDEVLTCDHQFREVDGYYTCIKCCYCSDEQVLVQQIFQDDEKHKSQFMPLSTINNHATLLNPNEGVVSSYYKGALRRAIKYKEKNSSKTTKENFLNNYMSKVKDYFTQTVTNSARRLFKKLVDLRFAKGRDYVTTLATSLYIASNNEKQPKLLFEIEKIFEGINEPIEGKDITKVIKLITTKGLTNKIKITHKPSIIDYTPNYCAQVDLPQRITNEVTGLITYLLDYKSQDKMRKIIENYKIIQNVDTNNLESELNKKELKFLNIITNKESMITQIKKLSKDFKKTILINPSIIGRSEAGTIGGAMYYCIINNQLTEEELNKISKKLKAKISQRAIANYMEISEIVIRHNFKIIELYKAL